MGWATIALTVVSTIAQVAAAKQQGQAAKAAADYQAGVARNNQIIAEQNATYAQQKGDILEAEKRQQTAQVEAHQRAKFGAAGFTMDAGSPLRIQEDIAQLGTVDALTIKNNAAREAYGWKTQGLNYAAEAQLDQMRGESASRAGNLGAFSSIVGGASSVAEKWNKYKNTGVDAGLYT